MATSKTELAERIRSARDAAHLTQADLAKDLGIPRSAVAEIEAGRRGVSSLELERIAFLVGRDMAEFLADEFREDDVLNALFRAEPAALEGGAVVSALRHFLALARELQNLERLAELERSAMLGATYAVAPPRTRWDAIVQGERAAEAERQRLGLGKAPLGDLVRLLDSQGVRTAFVELPNDISGLTIATDATSALVAVNESHHANRHRFSFAHEYCHVVLDRDTRGRVSRSSERNELREVRANAFAAAWLMPQEGVFDSVALLGKGRPSRQAAAVFDEEQALSVESRAEPGSQDIQYYDVLQLASQFGTSPAAMIYRLRNLKIINETDLARLRTEDDTRRAREIQELLSMASPAEAEDSRPRDVFAQRFVSLALEVYRRGKISRSKLGELAHLADLEDSKLERLLESTGLSGEALTHQA